MSPYETGDISLESERVATSGRDFLVCQERVDVCQSGGAAPVLRPGRSSVSKPAIGKTVQPLWHTSAAAGPAPRRLPERTRARILELARTRYAGFNDHHFREKLCDVESLSIERETLRRLLRSAGIGSPRKRRAPTHRQRRVARAKAGWCSWTPVFIIG
jgi:hypothetical protein